MKIILSRKGFDSEYGGYPSPILPDGRLLPIPDANEGVSYGDLLVDHDTTYFDIMHMLKPSIRIRGERPTLMPNTSCHLDPDIRVSTLKRKAGWKGLFGQIDAAQSHLHNQGVGVDDLFLFFGWFRQTVGVDGKIVFDQSEPHGKHIVYGYLQVGEVRSVTSKTALADWILYHPHTSQSRREKDNNTIYVAREHLSWSPGTPGFGVFRFAPHLVLTAPNATRSKWKFPSFFKETSISYHSSSSWKNDYFQSAGKGQEFVINANEWVTDWAKELIEIGWGAGE
jgi:hypothetical protein